MIKGALDAHRPGLSGRLEVVQSLAHPPSLAEPELASEVLVGVQWDDDGQAVRSRIKPLPAPVHEPHNLVNPDHPPAFAAPLPHDSLQLPTQVNTYPVHVHYSLARTTSTHVVRLA
jgi:hypothetical protein